MYIIINPIYNDDFIPDNANDIVGMTDLEDNGILINQGFVDVVGNYIMLCLN